MARADRAELEAARLRAELAAAKAPPADAPVPAIEPAKPWTPLLLVGAVLIAVTVGMGAWVAGRPPPPEKPAEALPQPGPDWSSPSGRPVHAVLTSLAQHEGITLDDLQCALIAGAHDPNAFMCRAHVTAAEREKLTRAFGLNALHPSIASSPNGCAKLVPYIGPKPIERFSHAGAAALPKPNEPVIKLLYANPATYDMCLEIDYAEK